MSPRVILLFVATVCVLLHTACKKDRNATTGGSIRYSADTVRFDTVFTAAGSFTTQVKLYNPQNREITISGMHLEGPDAAYFHLNINGVSGNDINNVTLAAKDSMYVFATVKIDPTNTGIPFVVNATLITTVNGKDYPLPFTAYGQNAYYIKDSVLETQTWKTDKPYVILGYAFVDAEQTLTLPAGCRLYFNADARLFVDGTLKAIGTKTDSIIMQGDRLDRKYYGYEGYPGEWGGLYFTQHSTGNVLDYVILKNCGGSTKILGQATYPAAIQVYIDSTNSADYQLILKNTIVENSIGYGLLCFNSHVKAENCLFNCCGAQALSVNEGGYYLFDNCNFITYGNKKVNHTEDPTVNVCNYFDVDDYTSINAPLEAVMRNCIVWGSLETEFFANRKGKADYDLTLQHCILKTGAAAIPAYVKASGCLINTDPLFNNGAGWNFALSATSPARGAGVDIPGLTTDLNGRGRIGKMDIGCYAY